MNQTTSNAPNLLEARRLAKELLDSSVSEIFNEEEIAKFGNNWPVPYFPTCLSEERLNDYLSSQASSDSVILTQADWAVGRSIGTMRDYLESIMSQYYELELNDIASIRKTAKKNKLALALIVDEVGDSSNEAKKIIREYIDFVVALHDLADGNTLEKPQAIKDGLYSLLATFKKQAEKTQETVKSANETKNSVDIYIAQENVIYLKLLEHLIKETEEISSVLGQKVDYGRSRGA